MARESLMSDAERQRFNRKRDMKQIPGWATWTPQEAEDYIENNVTDLASAKVVLKAMAKMIAYLRDLALSG